LEEDKKTLIEELKELKSKLEGDETGKTETRSEVKEENSFENDGNLRVNKHVASVSTSATKSHSDNVTKLPSMIPISTANEIMENVVAPIPVPVPTSIPKRTSTRTIVVKEVGQPAPIEPVVDVAESFSKRMKRDQRFSKTGLAKSPLKRSPLQRVKVNDENSPLGVVVPTSANKRKMATDKAGTGSSKRPYLSRLRSQFAQ